jgi:type I restriction enzyme S subunit
MGQSPSGKSYNESGNGMIFFQGRRDFGNYFPTERVYTTEPKRLAKKDDILLSVRAPVGDVNIALKDCCIGRGLAALKHKSNSVSYSYLVIKNLRKLFDGYNTEGTVFGSVNQKNLKSLKIVNEEKIVKKFHDIVEPIFEKIKNNTVKTISLQQTRDTLLPKLLSGELDISEVEI